MSLSSHHLNISHISSPVLLGNDVEQVDVTRLSPAIGAIVSGVNLAYPLTSEVEIKLRELLLKHQVLFFRNQTITPHEQRAFAQHFGPLHLHPIYPTVADVPEIIVLDTEQNDLKDNALWHTDVTFSQTPPLGAVLAARHLPSSGGDTLWASTTAAYDALSEGMKQRLEHLTALHDFTHSFPLSRFGRSETEKQKWLRAREQLPPVEHPVIRVHPETNKRAIFVNEGFTTEICGLEAEESAALLRFLFQHVSKPEFSVRWTWQKGDVAFWDNRATQHYAVNDYRPHHRIMHRATILGDRPFGPATTQQQKHS